MAWIWIDDDPDMPGGYWDWDQVDGPREEDRRSLAAQGRAALRNGEKVSNDGLDRRLQQGR